MAQRIQGSPDLYASRGPTASINFLTAHDGFTLHDMVSYNEKHNEANGEGNRDGANDNDSWNCGWEGPTDDPGINALRIRQMKNALTYLMVSQGVPMILMGDEMGRTKAGQQQHLLPRQRAQLAGLDIDGEEWGSVALRSEDHRAFAMHTLHCATAGISAARIMWAAVTRILAGMAHKRGMQTGLATSRLLAFLLCGENSRGGMEKDNFIYVALNTHWEDHWFEIPGLPEGLSWHVAANTGAPSPDDIFDVGDEPLLENQDGILVGNRSTVILVGK